MRIKLKLLTSLDAIVNQALEQMKAVKDNTNEETEQNADDTIGVEGEDGN